MIEYDARLLRSRKEKRLRGKFIKRPRCTKRKASGNLFFSSVEYFESCCCACTIAYCASACAQVQPDALTSQVSYQASGENR
jgi:hypothetical protein